jgi:nucleotide-binding universal stress UspA family protein
MQRFRSILLVLNPKVANEEAISRAVSIARNSAAKLTLVYFGNEGRQETNVSTHQPRSHTMHEIACKARQQEFEDFLARVDHVGIDVDYQLRSGAPHRELMRTIVQEKHDLVITTVANATGRWRRTRDRTALHLVRNCSCPVWVFRPNRVVCFTRILAAVDVSPDVVDSERDALNVQVMDLATSLAQQDRSEVHVVQPWTLPTEKYLRCGWLSFARELPGRLRDRLNDHEESLKNLLRRYESANPNIKVHLPNGDPRDVILPLARREQVDLIVVGTKRPAGMARVLGSGTVEAVLRQMDCSVLAVKPENRASPLSPDHSSHRPVDTVTV